MRNEHELCALLSDPKFFELRYRKELIMGEPKGPLMQREFVGYHEYYDLAWSVSDFQVKWVRAKSLDELPRLIATSAWR